MDKNLIDLVNSDISLSYKGKEYKVRKASIRKAILYQEFATSKEVNGKPGAEQKIVAYAVFLMLQGQIEGLTQEDVLDNMPGDVDVLELLAYLGFMKPEKLEMVKRLQEQTINRLIGQKSSLSSLTAQDGPPTKSESSPLGS